MARTTIASAHGFPPRGSVPSLVLSPPLLEDSEVLKARPLAHKPSLLFRPQVSARLIPSTPTTILYVQV